MDVDPLVENRPSTVSDKRSERRERFCPIVKDAPAANPLPGTRLLDTDG
jgi:hypothetical protein